MIKGPLATHVLDFGTLAVCSNSAMPITEGGATVTREDDAQAPAAGSYASVNGLDMYYEVHGTGRPLVLLHGAYMTINAMGAVLPSLAETRRVIAVELQGHTADIPGTTHVGLVNRSGWLGSMIGEFLDAPTPDAGRDAGGGA